ncbi:MAG: methyltransferase domain-containing protein [Piscirickettsiaceae bacterium]|nr:methyltransferase domain-containing protein [Piscirickettsiaceae bacterium]
MTDYKTNKEKRMSNWWKSALGRHVLEQERAVLQSLSTYFDGDYQVQLGVKEKLLPTVAGVKQQKVMAHLSDVDGCNEALPFKCYGLDTLLLIHVLEFSDDPHQVLREVERVLVADGTVILCCFNPWSWWGLRCLFSWQDTPPWNGHFFRRSRIKDWLSLLNFEIVATEKVLFRPPVYSEKWFAKLAPMERWGKRLWSIFSGVSIIVATKRTIPLTPIFHRWQTKRLFPAALANKPVIKEKINE